MLSGVESSHPYSFLGTYDPLGAVNSKCLTPGSRRGYLCTLCFAGNRFSGGLDYI